MKEEVGQSLPESVHGASGYEAVAGRLRSRRPLGGSRHGLMISCASAEAFDGDT